MLECVYPEVPKHKTEQRENAPRPPSQRTELNKSDYSPPGDMLAPLPGIAHEAGEHMAMLF